MMTLLHENAGAPIVMVGMPNFRELGCQLILYSKGLRDTRLALSSPPLAEHDMHH